MSSLTQQKPLVLVVSMTGHTGKSITNAFLKDGNFRVASVVRPSSINKPVVKDFQASGVEIREGDIADPNQKNLDALVQGVDILILSVLAMVDQKPIILAAKRAGVKRVIPSDFGPPAGKGVMWMNDIKLDVRQFIIDHEIPHTFIDVGWWTHALLPYPHSIKVNFVEALHNVFYHTGKAKVLCTSLESVGPFVVRIISDPRTLNKAVVTWECEVTVEEVRALAEKISGEDFSDYPRTTKEEVFERAESADLLTKITAQYAKFLYVNEECTLEKAKALGDIDARELYPDFQPRSLEEVVGAFYRDVPRSEGLEGRLEFIPGGAESAKVQS